MPRLSSVQSLQDGRFDGPVFPLTTVSTLTTAGNLTLTTAQILGGLILRAGNGGARTDTLPTAAALVEAIQGCMVGTSFEFVLLNNSATAVNITLAAGTGGTASGTMATAQNNSKIFCVVFTNVTIGSEAYTLYSFGGSTF